MAIKECMQDAQGAWAVTLALCGPNCCGLPHSLWNRFGGARVPCSGRSPVPPQAIHQRGPHRTTSSPDVATIHADVTR